MKGAKVKFRELPVTIAKKMRLIIDEDFTIKTAVVRVNNLGDLAVFFELDQLPGELISPNVLAVKGLDSEPVNLVRDNTFRSLIEDNIELSAQNAALRHTLNRGLRGDFDSE